MVCPIPTPFRTDAGIGRSLLFFFLCVPRVDAVVIHTRAMLTLGCNLTRCHARAGSF